jgi:hypothetical protein
MLQWPLQNPHLAWLANSPTKSCAKYNLATLLLNMLSTLFKNGSKTCKIISTSSKHPPREGWYYLQIASAKYLLPPLPIASLSQTLSPPIYQLSE